MYTPQHFEMEVHWKINTILDMPLKTNNTASTLIKPAKNVYKVTFKYLSIITVKAFIQVSILLVISGSL
jgi:hypothetical protein